MQTKILKLSSKKGFSLLTGINREIIPRQIRVLVNSIKNIGIIRPVVVATINFITGKPVTYILDGQHLFHACIQLELDIPYIEIEIKNLQQLVETIALLNSSSKSWTLDDYILAWGSIHEDYKKLNQYLNIYNKGIPDRLITEILHKIGKKDVVISLGGGSGNILLKEGRFTIFSEKSSSTVLANLKDISDKSSLNSVYKRTLLSQIATWINKIDYNHNEFMPFFSKNLSKFEENTVYPEKINGLLYKFQPI